MENPIKMDDLRVPLFLETPTYVLILSYLTVDDWNPTKPLGMYI